MSDIEQIKNLTINKIIKINDFNICFYTSCNRLFNMTHKQDCCENVYIDQIDGNLEDLLDSPLIMAELIENEEDSNYQRWSFYKFATVNGYVTIKWYGSSNGYYSTRVSFDEVL